MIKYLFNFPFLGSLLIGGTLLANCGGSGDTPLAAQRGRKAPTAPPGVVDVVRHYADLMARQTRLTTPASRRFADSLAVSDADGTTFYLSLPLCYVEARLDSVQRLETVYIDSPASASASSKPLDFSVAQVGWLVRLNELRQVFGPGKRGVPSITKERATRRYPVVFSYRPVPEGRPVAIEANMPVLSYADSAKVYSIAISSGE